MTDQCTTYHHACDCREARFAAMEAALRELLAIQGDIMRSGHGAV